MVGRLCALVSVFIPGYLLVVMAGRKRAMEVLPAIVACGVSFAGMQFVVSNYVGAELTDIVSSLTCIVVMLGVMKLWKPKSIMRLEHDRPATVAMTQPSGRELALAWLPYLLLVVFVLAWGEPDIKKAIDTWTNGLLPAWFPINADGAERPERSRAAQPDSARAAGHGLAVALRRRVHVQLAERIRHGVPAGHADRRAAARHQAEAGGEGLHRHLPAAVVRDAHHRLDARAWPT